MLSPFLPPAIPEAWPDTVPERITVTRFELDGNTVFTTEELGEQVTIAIPDAIPDALSDPLDEATDTATMAIPLAAIVNQSFSLEQLYQVAAAVAGFYAAKGYSTSGAEIFIPQTTQQTGEGIVRIDIIEDRLEDLILVGPRQQSIREQPRLRGSLIDGPEELQRYLGGQSHLERLRPGTPQQRKPSAQRERLPRRPRQRLNLGYVRSRLNLNPSKPLNIVRLQESLQLLQLDPLIATISAQLSAGSAPGQSILEVRYREANSFQAQIDLDNGRSPSVGSFKRGIALSEANLLGLGDRLSLGYTNTEGSNAFNASYTIPLNARNGSLQFDYSTSQNNVIESPFSRLDIESASRTYDITWRQPAIRSIRDRTFEELTLSLTASHRESESSLLDIPFPLSPGADNEGVTRVSALRFSQDWTLRNPREVIALRSQFSLGLDALNSTINEPIPGIDEGIPDSRFFSWRGQAQYVRLLAPDALFIARINGQLADSTLLFPEQFAIGGFGSVRGYRQDTLLTDNALFASAEFQLPILRASRGQTVLQLIPFVDYGVGWNNARVPDPNPNTLAAVGLGMQWQQGDNFTARLDWGIPLVSVESRDRSLQENGLYFSMQWNLF